MVWSKIFVVVGGMKSAKVSFRKLEIQIWKKKRLAVEKNVGWTGGLYLSESGYFFAPKRGSNLTCFTDLAIGIGILGVSRQKYFTSFIISLWIIIKLLIYTCHSWCIKKIIKKKTLKFTAKKTEPSRVPDPFFSAMLPGSIAVRVSTPWSTNPRRLWPLHREPTVQGAASKKQTICFKAFVRK